LGLANQLATRELTASAGGLAGLRPFPSPLIRDVFKKNLIGGKWTSSASNKTFDVFNPADATVIARVPR
jgi:hypothetical protein